MNFTRHEPLERRTFKHKNPHMEFYCPLCGTQRAISSKPHMDLKNYVQLVLLTVAVSAILYPFMEWKGVFSFFFIWAIFEAALRLNFRKEVPCPHCGFDASWYKTDVKVARAKVDEFWHAHEKETAIHNAQIEEDNYEDSGESQMPPHNTHTNEFLGGEEAGY